MPVKRRSVETKKSTKLPKMDVELEENLPDSVIHSRRKFLSHDDVVISTSTSSELDAGDVHIRRPTPGNLVYILVAVTLLLSVTAVFRLYSLGQVGGHLMDDWVDSNEGLPWRGIEVVFWHSWLTAACTGLGVVPFIFGRRIHSWFMGISNALASGMMMSASVRLLLEGLYSHDTFSFSKSNPDSHNSVNVSGSFSGTSVVALAGLTSGVLFILASKRFLEKHEDVKFSGFHGIDAKKAILMVSVMAFHSITEGIGIGVSFGTRRSSVAQQNEDCAINPGTIGCGSDDSFGEFISATMAVHNIPEGLATCLVLIPRGTNIAEAFLWAVFTSVPQPLMAVPSFLGVTQFSLLLPAGLGFASGAMAWVSAFELIPEAAEEIGIVYSLFVSVLSGGMMWYVQDSLEH